MKHKKPSWFDMAIMKIKQIRIVNMVKFVMTWVILIAMICVVYIAVACIEAEIESRQSVTEDIEVQYEPRTIEPGDTLSELVIDLPGDYRKWVTAVKKYNDCTANIKTGEIIYLPVEVEQFDDIPKWKIEGKYHE